MSDEIPSVTLYRIRWQAQRITELEGEVARLAAESKRFQECLMKLHWEYVSKLLAEHAHDDQ